MACRYHPKMRTQYQSMVTSRLSWTTIVRWSFICTGPMRPRSLWVRNARSLMIATPLVSVVDDNESVRESLPDLLRRFGFQVRAFSSAKEFLASHRISETKCLVLD